MPYRINLKRGLGDELCRIAEEQIGRAISEIDDEQLERRAVVHQVRKRCKKVRGLLRLARKPLECQGVFERENAWYRDAARELSEVRDADTLIETYDRVMEYFGDAIDRTAFGVVRRKLTLRRQEIAEEGADLDKQIAHFRERLVEGKARVASWAEPIDEMKALAPGLAKTYRRGRRAMAAAYDDPTPERFHEWRKRCKYHWYHCRLLGEAWRPVMDARRLEISRLADLLGELHDLSVFRDTLDRERESFGEDSSVEALLGLIERRRHKLEKKARPLGERIFAESPDAFARRMKRYWIVRA